MDIGDITTGHLHKKRKSRIAMPANEFLPARIFSYGNWRQTDSRGLIRGVGRKEKGHIIGLVRENLVTSSAVYKDWERTDSFGLTQSALAALKDLATNKTDKTNKTVEQGDVGDGDDTKDCGAAETAEEKGADDGIQGIKAADGDRKKSCCGFGGCEENERKAQKGADMSDGLDSKAHNHDETMVPVKKSGKESGAAKEVDSKGEKQDAVWGRCSYPYTRLF